MRAPVIVAGFGMSGCPGRARGRGLQDVAVSAVLIDSVCRDLVVSAPGRWRDLQDLVRLTAWVSAVSCMSRPADTAICRYLVLITVSGCG